MGKKLLVIIAAWLVQAQPVAALSSVALQELIQKYGWGTKAGSSLKALAKDFLPSLGTLVSQAETGFADPGCHGEEWCEQAIMVSELETKARQKNATDRLAAEKASHEATMKEIESEMSAKNEDRGKKEEEMRRQQEEVRRRQEEARRRAEEQRRLEQERSRFSFQASGDPILCPVQNGSILEEYCVNYTGPAAAVCFDGSGLRSVHFVGVCDEDGSNQMGGDAWWVGEVWTAIIEKGVLQWKFRNATGTHEALLTCDDTWQSEVPADAMPSDQWLEHFRKGKTFMLHDAQPRIMQGPKAGELMSMLFDPEQLLEAKGRIRTGRLEEHLQAMLFALGFAQEHGILGKAVKLLMLHTLRYGLAVHMKA